MKAISDSRLEFWNSRSSLGLAAGSGDVNLKRLEIASIYRFLEAPSTVLDAGCGNACSLISLADQMHDCSFFGFDYSPCMVKAGLSLVRQNVLESRVQLCHGDLMDPPVETLRSLGAPSDGFDAIFTERSLINLDNFDQQAKAVRALWDLITAGGRLILCESFLDGLNEINFFRESVGLSRISPPWHNRYLTLSEVGRLLPDLMPHPEVIEFSGSYYFVSRVVHARAALLNQEEPAYDNPLNIQALDLPSLPVCGQSKIIIFRKP